MQNRRDMILSYLRKAERMCREGYAGITTAELSAALQVQRCNVSSTLNRLVEDGLVEKSGTRPVYYRMKTSRAAAETSAFVHLTGAEGSLKNAVQLAKAAMLYPEAPLGVLLTGAAGSGKSYFVSLIYEFAGENGIAEGRSLKEINCRYYADNEPALVRELEESAGQDIFINHIHLLNGESQAALFHHLEKESAPGKRIIVCAADTENHAPVQESIAARFPVRIEIPSLAERSLQERFDLIKVFFMEESGKMGRSIKVNAELLHCLILYHCIGDVKQLRNDICVGCAKAYVREFRSSVPELHMYVYDFPGHVRKGFLNWKYHRKELEKIIPRDFSFSFSTENMNQWENRAGNKDSENNIYDIIEEKESELRKQGMEDAEITAIISADLEGDLKKVQDIIAENNLDTAALEKQVDFRIIALVEKFLKKAGETLGRAYSNSVFYGLCLHLSALQNKKDTTRKLSSEKLVEVMESCKDEYILSQEFALKLERALQMDLPVGEIAIIAMFISRKEEGVREEAPVVLIAMHGNTAASSICEVVNALSTVQNTYAFDFPLDMNTETAYRLFVDKVKNIDQGRGILMVHDIGSIRTIAELAEQETGIPIKCIEVPLTLVALGCSRKAADSNDTEEAYHAVMESLQKNFPFLRESYQRIKNEKVIVTLCMTGQGGAIQLKNYIEKNMELGEIKVVPLAVSDKNFLLREVDAILEKNEIVCMVGTFDPKLYNIPFVSISKLFETPVEKLPLLMAVGDWEPIAQIDYNAVYDYLQEQLPNLDFGRLRRHLPRAVAQIKKAAGGLSEDQELGLFMHLACSVGRLQTDDPIRVNRKKDKIIETNKKLYHELTEILHPMEKAFHIRYSDNEIASLIEIIKRI